MSTTLRDGDVITLGTDTEDAAGFLSTDTASMAGTTAERLILATSPRLATSSKEVVHPPAFETRCLFRVSGARGGTIGGAIVYGQPIMLIHVGTDMCLCATSDKDVELLPVLEDDTGVRRAPLGGLFFAEPKHKLRTEGDRIAPGDHLLFHPTRFASSYLHASQAPLKYAPGSVASSVVDDDADDCVLFQREGDTAKLITLATSRERSGWVVQRYVSGPSAKHDHVEGEAPLRGGDMLRLFHREKEGYLVASLDTDALREEDYPLTKVLEREGDALAGDDGAYRVCVKRSNMMSKGTYSHSPMNIWQAQPVNAQTGTPRAVRAGEPIAWYASCRFRHVSSGRFLCVLTDDDGGNHYIATLADKPGSVEFLTSSTFTLLPISDDDHDGSGALSLTSFVRVRHAATSLYLVLSDAVIEASPSTGADDGADAKSTAGSGMSRGRPGPQSVGAFSDATKAQTTGGLTTAGGDATEDRGLLALGVSPECSTRDVFCMQPLVQPDQKNEGVRHLHRVQRAAAMLRRFAHHLEGRSAAAQSVVAGAARHRVSIQAIASREMAFKPPPPPDAEMQADVVRTLKELICLVVGIRYDGRVDVFKIDETPKKRLQNLLRHQLVIEHLMRVIELAWKHFFGEKADRVKKCRRGNGWATALGPLSEVCELSHALLRVTIAGNNRCAEQLQTLDAVETLLAQLPTGWAPPVVEVFDALMRSDGAGGNDVNKSDIRNMMDMIDDELHKVDGVAPAMLLDFLSSVCRTGKHGHERMQNAIGQLLCGLISEGGDPHMSSLVYHLRLLAAPTANERLRVVEVQISPSSRGKTRPAYTADGEAGETDITYEQWRSDELVGEEDEAAAEATFVDLLHWLPHEERVGDAWVRVEGRGADGTPTRDDHVAYFRAQLNLFAKLVYGRNMKTAETIVELVPLEALLVLLQPPPSDVPNRPPCRLLPQDKYMISEIVLNLYLDSPKLDAQKETLIPQLYLWEKPPPPRTPEEREKFLESLICSPESQISPLEADESSPWARSGDAQGVPVWIRRVPESARAADEHTSYRSPSLSGAGYGSVAELSSCTTTSSFAGVRAPSTLVGGVELGGGQEEEVARAISAANAALEKGVLEIDEVHVFSQQRRLLAIVESALSEPDVLVYKMFVPPEDASEEQQRAMAEEKERFRYNLSTLRMMRVMAADGMYLGEYFLPPVGEADANAERFSKPVSPDGIDVMPISLPGAARISTTRTSKADSAKASGSPGARETIETIRKLEKMLLGVLKRSEPHEYMRAAAADYIHSSRIDEEEASHKVLTLLYTKTTDADVILVDAKVELCKILRLMYDMYTDARLRAVVSRYTHLYAEHVERKLWEKRDAAGELLLEQYEETMPFDRADKENELPEELLAEYPGLRTNEGGSSTYTYADVFERLCYLDLKELVIDSETLFEMSQIRSAAGSVDDGELAAMSERLMNLTLYDDIKLRSEAFTLLQRRHSQRDELRSSLASLRLIVDPEEKATYEYLSERKSRFAMISATADTTAPVWSYLSPKTEEFVTYPQAEAAELERAYAADATGSIVLADGKVRVHFAHEEFNGGMVAIKLIKRTGEPIFNRKTGKPVSYEVRRAAPYDELLAIIDDFKAGVAPLCYRRLSDEVEVHTGRPYDRNDPEESERFDKDVAARRARDGQVARWEPSKDMLEEGNQAMMVQEGWHKQILRFLGCYGDGSMGKRTTAARAQALSEDRARHIQLKLVAACYRMLYYICLDHPQNWSNFSDARTLNFLFAQLSELAETNEPSSDGSLDGRRLNYWVGKLLEEILVDNSEANKRLEQSHIDRVVEQLVIDVRDGRQAGRTQYILILKAMVEDEVQPLYERQQQVVEALQRVGDLAAKHGVNANDVLFYCQDEENVYQTDRVTGMYAEERERVEASGVSVDEDGLPDPSNIDCDINYHLELVDLLGMCAKGRNELTEKYSRDLFDEADMMRILSYQSESGWNVNTLFLSPFVRMLHGVFFSAVAVSDEDNASGGIVSAADTEASSASAIVLRNWPLFVRLFASFESGMRRFSVMVRLDDQEDEEERELERQKREGHGRGSVDNPMGSEKTAGGGESGRGVDAEEAAERAREKEEEGAYLEAMREKRVREAEKRGVSLDEIADEDEDESSTSDAKWDLLENYIFFVVLPFLTDFYTSEEYALTKPDNAPTFEDTAGGEEVVPGVAADAPEGLLLLSRMISSTARRMTRLDYVMGKEMLRESLDKLLNALYIKTVVGADGATLNLVEDDDATGGNERTLLKKATDTIDEWEEDDDLLEGGGDDDMEVRIMRVRKKFITELARAPFEAALGECMWVRDHAELRQRHEEKLRRRKTTHKRDWELYISPPVPTEPYLLDDRGHVVKALWYDKGKSDDGKAIDVSLLGEWSAEFNELVDLYFDKATEMVRQVTTQQSAENDAAALVANAMSDTDTGHRVTQDMMDNFMNMGADLLGAMMGPGGSKDSEEAAAAGLLFTKWNEHGKRYISSILQQLQTSTSDKHSECNRTLVDILTSMLATEIIEAQVEGGRFETTTEIQQRRTTNLTEHLSLGALQLALANAGALDTIIAIISSARDIGARTPYEQAIVPKAFELATEMMRYGPRELQNRFVESLKASLGGYASAKDFLPALKEQLLNSKKGCISLVKQALEVSYTSSSAASSGASASSAAEKQLSKLKTACDETTTLLTFLQMLCENHNSEVQTFLQRQPATRSIDIVSSVSDALRELCDTMSERTFYIRETDACREMLEASPPTAAIGRTMMGIGAANAVKLIAWHYYESPAELQALAMQCTVAAQTFETLTEFVQGPCTRTQNVLATQAYVCEMVGPLLEFLLALQVFGKAAKKRRGSGTTGSGWTASNPVELTERLKGHLSSAECERAEKWLGKHGCGDAAEIFQLKADNLLHEARQMEISMLTFLAGLLEGETPDDIINNMIAAIPPTTIISLLNLHWQAELTARKARLAGRASALGEEAKDESELTFLYFSTLQLLTEDNVSGESAERLRFIYRKWIAEDGRDISRHARKIEIVDAEGNLGRLYFQMPEFIDLVWRSTVVEEHKRALLYMVNRDSAEEKLKDFWLRIDGFIAALKHQHQLRTLKHRGGAWKVFGVLIDLITRGHIVWFWLSLFLAVLINIFLLFPRVDVAVDGLSESSSGETVYDFGLLTPDSAQETAVLGLLSVALIVMTSLELLAHIIGEAVLRISEEMKAMRKAGGVKLQVASLKSGSGGAAKATTADSKLRKKVRALLRGEEVLWRVHPATYASISFFADAETLIFIFFLVTAVLSLAHQYEWSCVNLLALARRVPEMRYVVQVMGSNLAQLLNTLALCVILIYCFSIFAWMSPVLKNQYAILDKDPGMLGHESMLLNSLFFWDYGFREAPAFSYAFTLRNASSYEPADGGDSLDLTAGQLDRGDILVGFLFNVLYHILIILVFSAVVSGIIIDAFAEKRATNNAIRHDILNTCFICNIEREDFEQLNLDFKQHVREEHNLWDYAFFRLYLETKDDTKYTGLETFCAEQIRDNKISWFPIKKAIVIGRRSKEKKDLPGLYRRLNTLETHVEGHAVEMRAMRQTQREHGGALKDVKQDLSTVRKSVDEMKAMLSVALRAGGETPR